MIHRKGNTGLKLDVAGLNEIIVLVDRSETELTEVAMNSWALGLDGPPHKHDRKEQNFLVTAGRGKVRIGRDEFPARPGAFFYVPAGVIHQTINEGAERLTYFLFNAFLDSDKEGHASFAEHIEKVKHIRKQQAATQSVAPGAEESAQAPAPRPGRTIDTTTLTAAATPLLTTGPTERCEALHHQLGAGERLTLAPDARKEQTFYVQAGSAVCRAGGKEAPASAGDALFLPRHEAAEIVAGPAGFRAVSFGTVVAR